jgi:glutamine amidotransferase
MIAIIDYGAGNLRSVVNAIAKLGYRSVVTSSPENVLEARAVMLPGVGAAGDTMRALRELGMDKALRQLISEDRPLFAICIGIQVLFSGTEEGGWHDCLGVIPGRVKRFPESGLEIPHMGWNQVRQQIAHPIFEGIPDDMNFCFVHSYYCDPDDPSSVAGTTEYGIPFCSMVLRGNLVATQFHPEKSGEYGLRMYSNFLRRAVGEPTEGAANAD